MDPRISLVVLGFAASVATWIISEWRGQALVRRIAGVLSMILLAISAYHVGWLGPQYSISRYEQSLDRIREMVEAGNARDVVRAISNYRSSHPHFNPQPIFLLRELSAQ